MFKKFYIYPICYYNMNQKYKFMEKNDASTVLALFFIASAVMLIGGLALVPAIQEARAAANENREERCCGQQGVSSSDGKNLQSYEHKHPKKSKPF
jgi:hypothetical protein